VFNINIILLKNNKLFIKKYKYIILDVQRMANQQDLVYQQQQAALYQSQMLKRQLLDQTNKRMENVCLAYNKKKKQIFKI